MPKLTGKRALITGGSKGIGLAIAQLLRQEGCDIFICARGSQGVATAKAELGKSEGTGKVATMSIDIGRYEEVVRLFQTVDEEFGGLDILVNNAGFGVFAPTADMKVDDWDKLIATNLSGAFYCSKEALRRFKECGGGQIVNISSLAGKNPFAGGSAYNSSKFALNGLSEAMMLDHRANKVRVSYVMPGSVDTEFGGAAHGERSSWKIAPEDIADIVLGILKMPERTLISRVEVRPSLPKKN